MKETVILAAKTLLARNISFCVFRSPDTDNIRLGLPPVYFNTRDATIFQMSPFTPDSQAKPVSWKVVNDGRMIPSFMEKIARIPEGEKVNIPLPEETSKADYFKRIHLYLKAIRSGKLKKAILSRVIHVEKDEAFNPVDYFLTFCEDYPKAFVYLTSHPDAGLWMGATPELLLSKTGTQFTTMALAGTQVRRPDSNYIWRAKEMEEHWMVEDHIESFFHNFQFALSEKKGPYTIEAGKVAHLRTDYTFCKQQPLELKDLIQELHPTPAIGGLPAREAVDFIKENEEYDRGYYSGVIGLSEYSGDATFYINLRCMQIGEKEVAIFAGGGITAESDPEEEWEETIMKSKTMADKIGLVKEWN